MNDQSKSKSLWTSISQIPNTYPWLSENENTSVCVVGGGISAALYAFRFASCGIDTVLISPKPIGFDSTSLSDGTIKTDVCGGLTELSSKIGIEMATRLYRQCEQSLNSLENIALSLKNTCQFTRLGSLIYSQDEDLSYDLRKEYLIRRHNGLDVNVIHNTSEYINDSINLDFGLITKNKSAIVNPFIFTHMMVEAAKNLGARIYENSPVQEIIVNSGSPSVYTTTNRYIDAEKLIVETGNGKNPFIKNAGSYKTKFSIATNPIPNLSTYRDDYMIATKLDYPEITFSVTRDNRIITTGLTTSPLSENQKISGLVPVSTLKKSKYAHLNKELLSFFPEIKCTDIEYKFCYNYFETEDGLPIIGEHSSYPNCYFSICPGENNMIFSEITSNILLNLYYGKITDFDNVFLLYK